MSIHDVQLQLMDLPDQELLVEVQGPTVSRIRRGLLEDASAVEALPDLGNLVEGAPEHEPPIADVVELFLRGLEVGLLGAASPRLGVSQGHLASESLDPARRLKRWQLSLSNVHPGAFRVLRNLLRALEPERGVLQTLKVLVGGGRPLSGLSAWGYPPAPATLAFPIRRSAELAGRKPRTVRLTFRAAIEARREPSLLAAFDAWAHLLMLGGYLEDVDAEKGRLGAVPEPPALVEPHTVEMSFEVFNSGPAALDAVANLAHHLHQTQAPVESLEFD